MDQSAVPGQRPRGEDEHPLDLLNPSAVHRRPSNGGDYSGIGFCLLNSDIAAFDVDKCRDPDYEGS